MDDVIYSSPKPARKRKKLHLLARHSDALENLFLLNFTWISLENRTVWLESRVFAMEAVAITRKPTFNSFEKLLKFAIRAAQSSKQIENSKTCNQAQPGALLNF